MNIEQAKKDLLEALSGPGGKNWGYGPAVQAVLKALDSAESTLEREREKSRRALVQNHRFIVEGMAQREVIEAVRAVAAQTEGIAGWHHSGAIAGWDEILAEIFDFDTPNIDAAISDLKALGAEAVADELESAAKKINRNTRQRELDALAYIGSATVARSVAQEFREAAQ